MTRPRPRISEAQAKQIANFSKFEAKSQARTRQIEAMLAKQQYGFSNATASSRSVRPSPTTAKWLNRIAFFPVAILSSVLVGGTAWGIWSGDLPSISKYSKAHVIQVNQPVFFWFVAAFHVAVASLFSFLSLGLFKGSGWFKKKG